MTEETKTINRLKIKIWDIPKGEYWENEDGELLLFNTIEEAKEDMRKEGFKESFIECGVEYREHYFLDTDGYEYQ